MNMKMKHIGFIRFFSSVAFVSSFAAGSVYAQNKPLPLHKGDQSVHTLKGSHKVSHYRPKCLPGQSCVTVMPRTTVTTKFDVGCVKRIGPVAFHTVETKDAVRIHTTAFNVYNEMESRIRCIRSFVATASTGLDKIVQKPIYVTYERPRSVPLQPELTAIHLAKARLVDVVAKHVRCVRASCPPPRRYAIVEIDAGSCINELVDTAHNVVMLPGARISLQVNALVGIHKRANEVKCRANKTIRRLVPVPFYIRSVGQIDFSYGKHAHTFVR